MRCDRCNGDITAIEKRRAVGGMRSPTDQGGGINTEWADVCARCYRAVWKFIGITPRKPRRRRGVKA